jgi:dihydroorotase
MAGVLIAGERIVEIGGDAPEGAKVLDCSGLVIAPGFIDLASELGDPGETWREGLEHGSSVAAAGGFTKVIISPRTVPPLDEPSRVADLVSRAQRAPSARIGVAGALTVDLKGMDLAEMGMLVEAGCLALSDGGQPIADLQILRRTLEYGARLGVPIFLRPGVPVLEERGVMHEGAISVRVGLRGIPTASEEIGVAQIVALVARIRSPVHLTHVTTRRAVRLVAAAQAEGLPITASVPARHLLLTDARVEETGYDTAARVRPPLRPESDRQALCVAVLDGTLMIGADHIPWTRVEKELEFSYSRDGAVGLETAFSAALTALKDIRVVVRAMSAEPGRVIGAAPKIMKGAVADLVLLDPAAERTINAARRSNGVNEPLVGLTLQGAVRAAIVGGRLVRESMA